ncbi:hypothetical protein BGX27_008642 [Mortierella sp. AM989]|nr:hypothetical protein BGX27_008642 [Mortierella sp. AM989]
MFARQVDPLAEYNYAISAAQQQHRASQEAIHYSHSNDHLFTIHSSAQHASNNNSNNSNSSGDCDRDHGSNNVRNNGQPNKRKHTFHFEPEFFAALDSSIKDNSEETTNGNSNNSKHSSCSSLPQQGGSPQWSARQLKRAKKSTSNDSQASLPRVSVSQPTFADTPSTYEPASPNFPVPIQTPSMQPRFPPPSRAVFHMSHKNNISTPTIHTNSNGPSIIDLSSGEELVVLHLGSNERKRTRDNEPPSPIGSADSLREVFDYQDDVDLLPIRNLVQAQASPVKKVRLGKSSQHSSLRFLNEGDSDIENQDQGLTSKQLQNQRVANSNGFHRRTKQTRKSWNLEAARRNGSIFTRDDSCRFFADRSCSGISRHNTIDGDVEIEALARNHNEENIDSENDTEIGNQSDRNSINAENQTLIRHQAPAKYSIPDEVIGWVNWKDMNHANIIPLEQLMGNEMVLYKQSLSADLNNMESNHGEQEDGIYGKTENNSQLSVFIEELDDDDVGSDDDDGNVADDEACEFSDDGPLMELEEKIMDMDLD